MAPGRPTTTTNKQNNHIDDNLVTLVTTAGTAATTFLNKNDLILHPSQTLTLLHLLSLLAPPPPPSPPPSPPQCWFIRLLHSTTSDPQWPTFFRMSKPTFSLLLSLLSPSLSSSLPSISPPFALAATLYRLAHNAPYHILASMFGVASPEDACRAFFTVCKAVNEKLGYLVGFECGNDKDRVLMGFGDSFRLVNCCGVLGFGRFGSILVQAVVDSQGRFLELSAGWPCGLKPDSILCRTKLFSEVRESRGLVNGPEVGLGDGESVSQYVVGDASLPLLPWILTPYVGGDAEGDGLGLSETEREFNAVHRNAMSLVRMSIRRVRQRWGLLGKKWKEECSDYLPYIILMGCVLHNFLIKYNEPSPDENENVGLLMEMEEELPVFEGGSDESGRRIRDMVAKHLHQNINNQVIFTKLKDIVESQHSMKEKGTAVHVLYLGHKAKGPYKRDYYLKFDLSVKIPKIMDWVSWLSKSNIEPSLVYEYGLAFAGNELDKEDIPYLNHEILQSMGISVAKHRLEIIKLARKESGEGTPKNPSVSKLVLKFNKTKRRIAKRFNQIFHGDSTKSFHDQSPWPQETWSGTILTKSKSQRDRKAEKMMVIQDDDDDEILPRNTGPSGARMQEGMLRHSKSLRVPGSSDTRGQDRVMFPSGSVDLSAYVDGKVQDNRHALSNRKSRLAAPPDGRLNLKTASRNKEKPNPFDDDDEDDEENGDHLLWRAVHQDIKRN